MLYYDFNGYEGFKERFGTKTHGNGETSRKNKILLSYVSQPSLFYEAAQSGDYSLINISSMPELKQTIMEKIQKSGSMNESLCYRVSLMNYTFWSSRYSTDDLFGVCTDNDTKCVRYVNKTKNGNIYKMKAGKFLQSLIEETEFGQSLPREVVIYLLEEFTLEWQSYASAAQTEYKLVVDTNFVKIYSSCCCNGNFNSCMVDRNRDDFYYNSVDAHAAYLEDKSGEVVARCILFDEVFDENGKKYRYAERQYSTSDNLKRLLIDMLIREKKIDCYKAIGAACSEATSIIDINGKSLSDKKFRTYCDLEMGDTLSYQDTFKWYDFSSKTAYNYSHPDAEYTLDTTDLNLYGDQDDDDDEEDEDYYDSYHERYCDEVVTVYVNGEQETCDADSLDDFVFINGAYHHEDDVSYCDKCGKSYLSVDSFYSELTDEDYCCEECMEKAEAEYRKEHAEEFVYEPA